MTSKTSVRMTSTRASRASKFTASSVLELLKRKGTKTTRDGMLRYAIHADKAFGVTMSTMRQIAKQIGHDHVLAADLWKTEWYEARMLATLIDDPAQVTASQMESWCRDFDNWAIVDTACFALFDRTAHAWKKLEPWSKRTDEFQKRAAFALLWSLTVHDKVASDAQFIRGLELIEQCAEDERNFVKKAINMALRATGKRNQSLNAAAVAVARRLGGSKDATARWVGKDALRELTSASVLKRISKRSRQKKPVR